MPGFPEAPIAANPFVPDTTNYEARAERLGSKFSNLASNVGNIAEKISAYETLKKKMEDKQRFNAEILGDVVGLMKEHRGYSEKDITLASKSILNGEPEENLAKAIAFKKNIQLQKERGIDTIALYGESDPGYASRTKDPWAAKLSRKQGEGFVGDTKEAKVAGAITAGGDYPPTEATEARIKATPNDMSEYQSLKLQSDKERQQSLAKGKNADLYLELLKMKGKKEKDFGILKQNVKSTLATPDEMHEAEVDLEVSKRSIEENMVVLEEANKLGIKLSNMASVGSALNGAKTGKMKTPLAKAIMLRLGINPELGTDGGAGNTTKAPMVW